MAVLEEEKSVFHDSPAEQPQPGKKSSSPWKHLFAFTTPKQLSILTCAVTTAAAVAAGKTAYTYFLGRVFDIMAKYGAGVLGGQELLSQVSRWCGYTTVLGVGVWTMSSVDMALWITSGELRAMTARKTLFARLIQKEMGWFDSTADGMSSTIIQTQG